MFFPLDSRVFSALFYGFSRYALWTVPLVKLLLVYSCPFCTVEDRFAPGGLSFTRQQITLDALADSNIIGVTIGCQLALSRTSIFTRAARLYKNRSYGPAQDPPGSATSGVAS